MLLDRQTRLENWDQEKINEAAVLQAGCGGLGSKIGLTNTQMGVAADYVDHDDVELTNLNRQFFRLDDVGKPKAHALIKNIAPFATRKMTLKGYVMRFEEFARQKKNKYDVICAGVDSDAGNVNVARYGIETATPVVFINVSKDGEACRLFIQRPGAACFLCGYPDALEPRKTIGCAVTPAIGDILNVASGLAVRAVVGEILGIPIGDYNCRDLTFSGMDVKRQVARRRNCPLCRGAGMKTKQENVAGTINAKTRML